MSSNQNSWCISPSKGSINTVNPIRKIVDRLDFNNLPKDKTFISVSIGDPTKYPNFKVPDIVSNELEKAIQSYKYNGYPPSTGYTETRQALAEKYSFPHISLKYNDVFLTSGCSDALNIAFCSLLNEGDNILLPRPGFSLYETLCSRYNFLTRYYKCLPDDEWSIDIKHLESLIDGKTKAILLNNPSNPCGSVLTESNLLELLNIANKYKLPIISDETYENMVFNNKIFIPLASLSKNVPILTVSGISKQYLVPGWRCGWIIVYDPINVCNDLKLGIESLTTVILGPNSLVQSIIPFMINKIPNSYYQNLNQLLCEQANTLYNEFNKIPQLRPIKANGAMYLMCEIKIENFKDIKDDIDFSNQLLKEESISVLPGSIFGMPNYFRCVFCPPVHILKEIGQRMSIFCKKHSQLSHTNISKL